MDKVLFSHKSDEWYTPKEFFDKYNKVFHFTLDPCATEEHHLCEKYYTKEENGLIQDWSDEIVFCNPPYSDIKSWIIKADQERAFTVMLVPARVSTKWFHEYVYKKRYYRFIKGRLKFANIDNNSSHNAPFESIVIFFDNLTV